MTRDARPLPGLPLLLGCLLVFIGLGVGVVGYFQPSAAFPNIVVDSPALLMLTAQASARNVAMALALAFGLWLRDRRVLGVLFGMRTLTEAQDMLIVATTGNVPVPPLVVVVGFLLLFVGPEVYCTVTLLRDSRSRAEEEPR